MSHKILNSITPNDQKESGFNLKEWKTKAYDALTDDFNSPILIAHLFEAVKFIFALKDEKETVKVETEELNFNECLSNVLGSLSTLLHSSRAIIRTNFSIETVKFNRGYLESIFLNLVSNSIKYAKHNTYPKIHIHSQIVDGIINLVFKDEGLGFDMEKVKDRIFGFNQTFHDHKDSKGIGLYLVHSHLITLGGHIDIQSQINEGATFTITFKTY